jgi:hypothetical protein
MPRLSCRPVGYESPVLRWRRFLLAGLAVVLLAACEKVAVQTYGPTDLASPNRAVLTADGAGHYTFASAPSNMAVAAVDSSGGNLRQAFWPSDNPNVYDSQSCAVWGEQTGANVQQGAVLRVAQSGGRVRAISVTKNIWLGAHWIFNFHVWDTGRSPAYTYIGATDLSDLLVHNGIVTPLPWHFCARVIDGTVEFKVWTANELEPAYGDRWHSGRATLPAGWWYPGKAGWFVGHLQPNDTAVFTDLRTYKYVAAG